MAETTDATEHAQLTTEREHLLAQLGSMGRDRPRTSVRRPGRPARAASSTSTRASPTRARSPPSGARSTRSPASLLETLQRRRRRAGQVRRGHLRRRASPAASTIARGPARGDAGGPALHQLRVAASLSRHRTSLDLQQRGHLLRLPRRRGHPPRDQPRRRRAVVRRRHRQGAGRLTLNPVPHIDPFGSIILPAFGALSGIPVIAWAKPVPVNPNQLRNPRRNMLWVGPRRAVHQLRADVRRRARRPRRSTTSTCRPRSRCSTTSRSTFQIAVHVRAGEPVPRRVQPAADPAARRLVAARAGPPGGWLPDWYRFRPYGILVLFLLVFFTGVISEYPRPVRGSARPLRVRVR